MARDRPRSGHFSATGGRDRCINAPDALICAVLSGGMTIHADHNVAVEGYAS
jgi:hypothetical protein